MHSLIGTDLCGMPEKLFALKAKSTIQRKTKSASQILHYMTDCYLHYQIESYIIVNSK